MTIGLVTGIALPASAVPPAQTVFVDEGFTGASAGPNYLKPAAPGGVNSACLTASSNTSQTPIPGCGGTPDAAGSGALRLTSAGKNQEGGVGSTQSVPISNGLDAVFNSYQYGGSSADGIVFYLAATDPYNPKVPTNIGQKGGSLGYAPSGGSVGLAYGYLGIGLDVYGNFLNTASDGTGCSAAPGQTPNNVSVRGPGNGTTGYCYLTHKVTPSLHGTTRANSLAPVEILINPSSSTATASSGSGLTVPAKSYLLAVTPPGSSQVTMSGPLPTVPAGLYPASWVDPDTGYPYKLTYGWVGSTGGSTDIHEVNYLKTQTVNGPVPDLSVAVSDGGGDNSVKHGSTDTLSVTPTITGDGGTESQPVRVTTTFPTGVTPGTPDSDDWVCSLSGSTQTCTYTPDSPVSPGTDLPTLDLPFTATGAPGSYDVSYVVASVDTTAVSGTKTMTITKATSTITASNVSTSVDATTTLAATVAPSSATGTVTFTDDTTGDTLCTATLSSGSASCTATATAPASDHTVTASYGGDVNNSTASTTLTMTVAKASPTIVATATPPSVTHGDQSTLKVSGLPGAATGTVTFTDGDSNTLCTATLPTTSCKTAVDLGAAAYTVTASYSGDSSYNAATDSTTLTVNQVTPVLTTSASPSSVVYGSTSTLSVSGLPADATGTVTFAAAGTTLCTATLPSTSCATSSTLTAGTYAVSAVYEGDTNVAGATTLAAAEASLTVTKVTSAISIDADPASVAYGTATTLTASGVPTGATGTITFTDGGTTLCTATLPTTSCTATDPASPGTVTITATYSGDANHTADTAATSLTIVQATPSMSAGFAPTAPSYGDPVTISVTGLPTGGAGQPAAATGTITVTRDGGTPVCTITLPATSCAVSDFPAGSHAIAVSYGGDTNYASVNTTGHLTVAKANVALTATGSSVPFGTTSTLSVSGLPPAATGTVTFTSGGNTLCSVTLPATSCGLVKPTVGDWQVTALYSGDANHSGASAVTTLAVTKAPTTTAVARSSSDSPYGTPLTLTAKVPAGATGTVTFTANGITLCTVTLPETRCTTPVRLKPGAYAVTATYSGDATHDASSATTSFAVDKPGASLTATSSTPSGVAVAVPNAAGAKLTIDMQPLHGHVTVKDGQIVYVPDAGFTGSDDVAYTLTTADGTVIHGVLTVKVTGGRALPYTGVDALTLGKFGLVLIGAGALALHFGRSQGRSRGRSRG